MIKASLVRVLKFGSSPINPWLVAVRLGIDVGSLAVRFRSIALRNYYETLYKNT